MRQKQKHRLPTLILIAICFLLYEVHKGKVVWYQFFDLLYLRRRAIQTEDKVKSRYIYDVRDKRTNLTEPHVSTLKDNILQNSFGKVITRTLSNGWNIINHDVCNKTSKDFVLAYLKGPPKTPIYVYPMSMDHYVSKKIIENGLQEKGNTDILINYMKLFPNAVFLDLGANVGSFTLSLAALGYKVFAVECLRQNVARLCLSMQAANLTDKITIICNAITDRHERVSLHMEPGNIGMTQVGNEFNQQNISIDTILLDDLLEIYNFTEVVIKMDVERYEDIVLNGARHFFKHVTVQALLIEWTYHRDDIYENDGKFIVDFLAKHDLEPDVPEKLKQNYSKWFTYEVLFKRKRNTFGTDN